MKGPGLREIQEWIALSDGTKLAATFYFPEGEGRWPVVLEGLPYRKDDVTYYHVPDYRRLCREGNFVIVRVDLRGTGSSEGVAADEYPKQEQDDLCEVIEWLADQQWSNGSIGMFGVSYGGFNSIQVAMEQPPALKAIVPIFATDDRYTDDVHYYGGARKQLDFIDYPLYMACMNALPPVPEVVGPEWRELWKERLDTLEPWLLRWLEEQNDGPYWRHGSLRPNYSLIACPTMIVSGWADGYRNASFRMFEQLEAPRRLLFGPWAHSSTETSLPGPRIDLLPELIRWFDRWLRDAHNGIDDEPPILVFARKSTRPAFDLDSYEGEWRYEAEWPPARMQEQHLKLKDAQRASSESNYLAIRGDTGVTAWISCAGASPWGLPEDQRPDEAFSLAYDWPVEEELEILGYPRLAVKVAASVPVAYLSAKLCDVFPDGSSSLVARGFLNLTHRTSHSNPTPLQPGKTYDIDLELDATSWRFERGHTLRLDLAGSDWPNAWAPPVACTLIVEPGHSTLLLPVLRGESPPGPTPQLHPPTQPWPQPPDPGQLPVVVRVERDLASGTTTATVDHGGRYELDNGAVMAERYKGSVGVSPKKPGDAWARGHNSFRLEWGRLSVGADARATLRSNEHAYVLDLEVEADENGERVWAQRWERRWPRKLQ